MLDESARTAPPRRFAVALSYPSDYRPIVGAVAGELAKIFGSGRILYDDFHRPEFASYRLNSYLPPLYRLASELVVVFAGPEYDRKSWCMLEWAAISQLLPTLDTTRVMLLSFGELKPGPSIDPSLDGYLNVSGYSAEKIVRVILERYGPPRGQGVYELDALLEHARQKLLGRETEWCALGRSWDDACRDVPGCARIFGIVGPGGEGKTALTASWAAKAITRYSSCERALAWRFRIDPSHPNLSASIELFFAYALKFFGYRLGEGEALPADKGRALAKCFGEGRNLLVLDNVEELLRPPTATERRGHLESLDMVRLLRTLASASRGLCVVLTRLSIKDLEACEGSAYVKHELCGVPKAAAIAILRERGVHGADVELAELGKRLRNHPLTLRLIGGYLALQGGDVRRAGDISFSDADLENDRGAVRVMDAYVRWFEAGGAEAGGVLELARTLGLFDRAATAECLEALFAEPVIPGLAEVWTTLKQAQRNAAIARLESTGLVTVSRDEAGRIAAVDAHPLVRYYFAEQLSQREPETWRAAHARLYEHLRLSTEALPGDLAGLEPLYRAVGHGCNAGLLDGACDDVYFSRIQRGEKLFSTSALGAWQKDLDALAYFFAEPWSRLLPGLSRPNQGYVLSHTGRRLQAVGRLLEAREPTAQSVELARTGGRVNDLLIGTRRLGELELLLGQIEPARRRLEETSEYARQNASLLDLHHHPRLLAHAAHQAGLDVQAEQAFMQSFAQEEGTRPMTTWGRMIFVSSHYWHCSFLLQGAERASWRHQLSLSTVGPQSLQPTVVRASREAVSRVWEKHLVHAKYRPHSPRSSLIETSLSYLFLGRVHLYDHVVLGSAESARIARAALDAAVDGCWRAGELPYVCESLLSRAWCQAALQTEAGAAAAKRDLDDVLDIATRGSMRLLQADLYLYRARLFPRAQAYPWPTRPEADLQSAADIIEELGYARRTPELLDARRALDVDRQRPRTLRG